MGLGNNGNGNEEFPMVNVIILKMFPFKCQGVFGEIPS
jgi:hypothetical protein